MVYIALNINHYKINLKTNCHFNIIPNMSKYPDSELQHNTKLVLCIEKKNMYNEKSPIGTRMFIYWKENAHHYVVSGRQQDTEQSQHAPFAINCDSTRDLSEIIQFIVGKNTINVILYNINKYYDTKETDTTYEFFESQAHNKYKIFEHKDFYCKRKQMSKYLRMLKNTYSYDDTDDTDNNPLK